MRVNPRTHGRAAERDLAQLFERALGSRDAALDLARIAEKFLTEAYRRRVLQMRAPGLDDPPKFF